VNIVDPIVLLLVSLFALRGYFKGLFRESFSLLGWAVGFIVAVRYDEPAATLLGEYWELPPIVLKAVSFVALFLLVYILFNLTGWLLHRAAKVLFLQTMNRLGGVVIGAGKGTAFLALAIFLVVSFPPTTQGMKQKMHGSYLAPPLYQLARELVRVGKARLIPGDNGISQETRTARLF
jgi:membrane protein required for colicin V production